jgi:hypothetical protein
MTTRHAVFLVSLALVAGCASVKYEELAELPGIEQGKGLVVFYRPSRMGGAALTYQVHEGEQLIGVLRTGTYFYHHSDPGSHTFWAQTVVRNSVAIEVVEGETQYIKGDVSMGLFAGHPRLVVVKPDQGKAAVAKLKYAVPGN